ncbi:MAG TPA: ABC transporter ATP-binding protein [Xanthomonadales bacterium]|nr:ABC transporter ATP-binding protein [Xanthomonadales bacterium]
MSDAPPLLSVRDLHVSYLARSSSSLRRPRLNAVRGVSFELHEGRVFGLMGESGCGKTSLARAIVRLTPPSAGEVRFRGQDMRGMDGRGLRRARREIQYLFQDPLAALSPRRNIWQTLLEPLVLHRLGNPADRRLRIEQALATVDLQPDVLGCYPHELSGGQRQRVALARVLVAEPALVIADEPMSSLDVSVQARILALMRKVQREKGISFLFISHDLAVVQQLADEVAVMYLGELVETAPAAELFANPAHPYTRALLAAAPRSRSPGGTERLVWRGEQPSPLTPPPGCVFHTRCPLVMDRCSTLRPGENTLANTAAGEASHKVRCHIWNS